MLGVVLYHWPSEGQYNTEGIIEDEVMIYIGDWAQEETEDNGDGEERDGERCDGENSGIGDGERTDETSTTCDSDGDGERCDGERTDEASRTCDSDSDGERCDGERTDETSRTGDSDGERCDGDGERCDGERSDETSMTGDGDNDGDGERCSDVCRQCPVKIVDTLVHCLIEVWPSDKGSW